MYGRGQSIQIYLPARSAQVLAPKPHTAKGARATYAPSRSLLNFKVNV